MQKKKMRFLYSILCLFLIFPFLHVKGSGSFTISNYQVDIQIDKSAVFEVKETIQIQDCQEMILHKDILEEYVYDVDGNGKAENYPYKISDIAIENGEISTDNEGSKTRVTIQIPDPNARIVLTYKVRMRNFNMDEQTLLLYSLLHPSMEGTIESFNANITFPNTPNASFDIYQVDANGNRGNPLTLQINNNTVSIQSSEPIAPGSGIMMSAILRKKYFNYSNPITLYLYTTILSILFVMGSYLWTIYPRMQKKHKRLLECYPLENMEIGTIGYLLDGVCDERDLITIIIEWANQNYIQIRDENQTVSLVLVNELPPSATVYEKHLFNLLFSEYTYVTIEQLKARNLRERMVEILAQIYESQVKKETNVIYTMSSYRWQLCVTMLVCLPMALMLFSYAYEQSYSFMTGMIGATIGFVLVYVNCLPWVWLLKNKYRLSKSNVDVYCILICLINLVCGGLTHTYLLQKGTPPVYSVCAITLTILYACIMLFMERRTFYGSELYERLLSLRQFIRRANSEQLHNLLCDNPYYFEDMLPYAYVFNITDIWGKKFTPIPLQAPFWYFHPNASANSTIYWMSALEKSLHDIQMACMQDSSKPKNTKNKKKNPQKKVRKQ